MQAQIQPEAEHAEEHHRLALRLDLLLVLGRGSAVRLELLRTRGRADLLLSGLGGEVLEQLQLSHPLHATLLHPARRRHHLQLLQSAHVHEQGWLETASFLPHIHLI